MAKEYIERDALLQEVESRMGWSMSYDAIYGAIQEAPAADVVEVVRCKDCIKRKTQDCSMYYEADGEQYSWEVDDDFCSCGERRDNA